MKQIIIAVLVVVGIIGGAVVLGKDKTVTGQLSNHLYGKENASVTLVEYADFECPACAFYYPIVEQVKEKYKDQVSFQFRNFPLVQTHRNALAAHRAAEAASNQGKFWEMYNRLFSGQETWNGPSQSDNVGATTTQAISIFETYAQELGLDIEKYKADVIASSTLDTINSDTDEGKKLGVEGTPSFFINGKKIEESTDITSVEAFSKVIDEALAAAQTPAQN